jgi:hypothetical protein
MTSLGGVADDERQRAHRAFGLVVVGMCVAVWWPAFTLGAWGDLFFDQMLTVWVAATAALVVVLVQPRSAGRRWPRALALAVPSLWLALFFLVGPDDADVDVVTVLVTAFGALVGLVGIPFTLWTLCRVLWPDLFTALRRRARWAVAAVVLAMAVASFLLGTAQNRFLTCEDFDVSGNSRPPGCVVEAP